MKINFIRQVIIALLLMVFVRANAQTGIHWSVLLNQQGKPPVTAGVFEDDGFKAIKFEKEIDSIKISVNVTPVKGQLRFRIVAVPDHAASFYLSLRAQYSSGALYTYLGEEKSEEIYRQSPHNPKDVGFGQIKMQDLPMIAIKGDKGFTVAINNSPVFYDNYTTQHVDPQQKQATLSSGDDGRTIIPISPSLHVSAYYPVTPAGKPYTFDGIIFKSAANNLNDLRKDVLFAIAKRWNNITDRLGATSWASNYMLLRKNETGNSTYWVVPGIKYSNKQYTRDSFWQSMVLPVKYDEQCYLNEAISNHRGSDRPLFTLIWAYRIKLDGGQPDLAAAQKSLDYIDAHTREGEFYSNDDPKLKNFQYWLDVAAFDLDDVITANQGLLAVALLSAEKLGLHSKTSSALAIKNYQAMFNQAGGYFPISKKKNLIAVDPLMGDLLAQVFFNRSLLSDASVRAQFNALNRVAKTQYGYKDVCLPDGSYAPADAYYATDFKADPSGGQGPGNYQAGGSWFLYDMLFLMDSYLHKVPGAKQALLWRGALDFKLGGTYFEFINTVTGVPNKPNQGWNAAVYAIWKKLMDRGLADNSLLRAINNVK